MIDVHTFDRVGKGDRFKTKERWEGERKRIEEEILYFIHQST